MDLSVISRTGGPVLLWRGPDHDSLDLTGPVVANWVNKSVGLFGDHGLGPDFTLSVPMPHGLHWRETVALLAVLLAGGRVVLGSAPAEPFHAFVPLGFETDESLLAAEEIFVYAPPALALSTPVDEDFIDFNSSVRAYPDVTSRRLDGSGVLEVAGAAVPWTESRSNASPPVPGERPSGLLVSHSTPQPREWPEFLGHLLGGGEVLLAVGGDEDRISDLAATLGKVRGRLGTWTK